jgi:capsular polysaccharide biosynthesis protein
MAVQRSEVDIPTASFPAREPSSVGRERRYVDGLRKGWWIVALALVVALGAAAVFTARQEPVYRSSATVVVAPNESVEGVGDVLRSLETLERRSVIATFARIPSAPQARATVAQRLGTSGDLDGYRIEAAVLPNTNILKIDVEGPAADRVAAVANAAADVMHDEVRALYRIFTTRTLSAATPPSRPIHPDPRRNYVVAGLLGLLVGVVAALAAEGLRSAPGTGS